MSSTAQSKVSFTIRRPTPVSRTTSSAEDSDFKIPALPQRLNSKSTGSPLARSVAPSPKSHSRTYGERDSSDEDEEAEDELVTGFDQFGVQRVHEKKKEPQGPLVIPPLQNRDWRELARKRKALYVPPSAAAETGADGSVGGLGTRDTINSGPQVSGLQVKKRIKLEEESGIPMTVESEQSATINVDVQVADGVKKEDETEDQKALRAILASAQSDDSGLDGPYIAAIPAPSEDDAYKQDVEELPESATLDDYERVPVSQFGAALLRGMGWKEGTAASKKQKGTVEPYLPQARPALLGIGAKEKEVFDDGSNIGGKGKKGGKPRPERRYVPVVKRERRAGEGEEDGARERSRERSSSSAVSAKRRSPSPERRSSRRYSRTPSPDRRRDRDRRDADYDRDRDRRRDDRREQDPSRRDRDRERDRRGDRSMDRHESGRRRDKDRR